jgi:adenylate cyclase
MPKETERKFLTTSYHLAVVRINEADPHLFHRLWLETLGAKSVSIATIHQQYLNLRLDETNKVIEEERVRKWVAIGINGKETKFTHTFKKGSGLQREELEEEIGEDRYAQLIARNNLRSTYTGSVLEILKYRTTVEGIGEKTLEIDRYLGALGGLCVTEIEFKDRDEAMRFDPKGQKVRNVLGPELSGPDFSNAMLAMRQTIPGSIILPRHLSPPKQP